MIDVICSCGKRVRVPDHVAGKKGRCSACGATMIIPQPDAAIGLDDDLVDLTHSRSKPSTSTVPVPSGDGQLVTTAKLPPALVEPEPWFYAHLWNYARLMKLSVNVVTWVLLALLLLFSAAMVYYSQELLFMPRTQLVISLAIWWGIGGIVIVVYRFFALVRAALMFMRVDQARNIRRIRLKADEN